MGASLHYKNWFTIESTFFIQWTSDSIHWSSGPGGIWRPENVGEAFYFGVDSKIRDEIPLSSGPFSTFGISLSYQYLLSYLLSYGYTWADEKRIPYMPMHTLGISLDLSWKTGSILLSGHYEGLRFANTANITELAPYFLLNVNVNQQIGKNLTAFAVVRNLLNTSYESFDDYPMPGITITLGLRFNIEPKMKEKK
ncbi:hypothetical protein AGMMS49942_24840 [Spirochaetia bacterium]|nr:hypothetical protein AGMMS49942_24840 [Spirochaetia bacterium]